MGKKMADKDDQMLINKGLEQKKIFCNSIYEKHQRIYFKFFGNKRFRKIDVLEEKETHNNLTV